MADDCEWVVIFNKLARKFNVSKLQDDQKSSIRSIIDHQRDVFVFRKTGSGKSFHYLTLTTAAKFKHPEAERRIVLVISPLISIMQEQTDILKNCGVNSVYLGHSEETDNDVLNNKVEVVFSSPELVIARPKWRDWVKRSANQLLATAVDETHTIVQW